MATNLTSVSDILALVSAGFSHEQITAMTVAMAAPSGPVAPYLEAVREEANIPQVAPSDNVATFNKASWTTESLSLLPIRRSGATKAEREAHVCLENLLASCDIQDKALKNGLMYGKGKAAAGKDQKIAYLAKQGNFARQGQKGEATVIEAKKDRKPFDHAMAYKNTVNHIEAIGPAFVAFCDANKSQKGIPFNYVTGQHKAPYLKAVQAAIVKKYGTTNPEDIAFSGDIYGPNFASVSVKAGVGPNPLATWLIGAKLAKRFNVMVSAS